MPAQLKFYLTCFKVMIFNNVSLGMYCIGKHLLGKLSTSKERDYIKSINSKSDFLISNLILAQDEL